MITRRARFVRDMHIAYSPLRCDRTFLSYVHTKLPSTIMRHYDAQSAQKHTHIIKTRRGEKWVYFNKTSTHIRSDELHTRAPRADCARAAPCRSRKHNHHHPLICARAQHRSGRMHAQRKLAATRQSNKSLATNVCVCVRSRLPPIYDDVRCSVRARRARCVLIRKHQRSALVRVHVCVCGVYANIIPVCECVWCCVRRTVVSPRMPPHDECSICRARSADKNAHAATARTRGRGPCVPRVCLAARFVAEPRRTIAPRSDRMSNAII